MSSKEDCSCRGENLSNPNKTKIMRLALLCGIHLSEEAAGNAARCLTHKSPSRLINILLIDILGERAIRNMHSDLDRRVFYAIQTIDFILMLTLNVQADVLATMKNLQRKLKRSTDPCKNDIEPSIIFEEAIESLLYLKDKMFSRSQVCSISSSSSNNSIVHLLPELFASNEAPVVQTESITTLSPEHKSLLEFYEEEMESDETEPSESPSDSGFENCEPSEFSCEDSRSTTVIVMQVNEPKKKELCRGKWIPIEELSECGQPEEPSLSPCPKAKHAAAKRRGLKPSEKTPTKAKRNSPSKSCKSSEKRMLHFGPQEKSEEHMEWQGCIEDVVVEVETDLMECDLEVPADLDLSNVSFSGVDFGSSQELPDIAEMLLEGL